MDSARSPSTDVPRKRTRNCVSKSRTGCARCKSRRVKCDEARPTCASCAKVGAVCPGYQQQLRWSTKYEQPQRSSGVADAISPTEQVIDIVLERATEKRHAHADNMLLSTGTARAPTGSGASRLPTMLNEPLFLTNELLDFSDDGLVSSPVFEIMTAGHDEIPNAESTLTTLLAGPTHIPTTLVEYWFSRICPLRSTFDSGINYNRQVAWSTWSSSEAVSSTMQAMSAACLVSSMPQLKEILPALRSQAVAAVSLSLARVQESSLHIITVDLIFAMLSLGTSLHWFACVSLSGSEYTWLESARNLLSLWKPRLEAADFLLHAYFSQALTYWDMLLAPVGRGSIPTKIRTRRRQLKNKLVNALNLSTLDDDGTEWSHPSTEEVPDVPGTRPNSWCGVSSEVIHLYGHALALCRSVSVRATNNDVSGTDRALDVLCEMSIARDLQKELLAIDFNVLILLEEAQGFAVVTQDHRTPVTHLLQTAEAFREAALLQLHLTFEDLPILPMSPTGGDIELGPDAAEHQSRKAYVRTLAFRLAAILENIPLESGSRSMHPMLYLAMTVGLCNTTRTASHTAHQPKHSSEEHIGERNTQPVDLQTAVFSVRRMTLTRLSQLGQMLPHASSCQVLQLVKALWSAYDDAQFNDRDISWFELVAKANSCMLL